MEGLEDQFPSEDSQDDDEQVKLQATISSILNSSLEDKESSAPKSSVDGNSQDNLLGLDGVTLHGNLEKASDGKTPSLDVDELLNKEVPAVLCEQDTENDAELTSEMPIMSMNERDASPITQQLQGEEMEHTEAEENINMIENSDMSPGKKQGELLMKVLDHAVTEENVASVTETRQTPPKKRGRSLPAFEENDSSVIQMSLNDGPSPEKKSRPASIGGSNLYNDKQKSKLPFQKKQGRPFKKVESFGEEYEDVDKRKSLRAPSKSVQYNEVDSSPEKDDRDTILEDNVSIMSKKSITNLTPREEREPKQPNPKKLYIKTTKIRTPKETEFDDSFFLPEGWSFYAKKRCAPANTKHFDVYYITPPCPHHKKIRSRQELIAYFTAKGLDYDPLQFFAKQKMMFLLEKGILKYHDKNTVILPSNQEVFAHLPPKRPAKGPMRKENYQDQTIKTEDEDVQSPAAKKENKQSKESFKNLMVDSKKNTTKISFPKMEPLSPSAKSQVRDKSPYVTKEKTEDKPGSLATPPKKKVGRPRKKVPLVPEVATAEEEESVGDKAVEEKPVEERVRIRSKPPRKSPYFSSSFNGLVQSKSLAGLRRERKNCVAPPRSPYNLIQEDLFHDPWQMLIATIFLNSTNGRLAIPLAMEFLKRWPTPQLACQAKVEDILSIIDALGFGRTRAASILRFSYEYLTKDWTLPKELYGIGDYGNDSYKIFCMKNEWKNVRSDDPMLMMYLNWRRATEHLRKRFLNADTPVNPESSNSSESSKKVLRPRVPTPSPKRRRGKGK